MIPKWVNKRRVLFIFMMGAVVWMITTGLFFFHVWANERDMLLHRKKIADCLESGGHIGAGDLCWYADAKSGSELLPSTAEPHKRPRE
jgi:hypothetical protein